MKYLRLLLAGLVTSAFCASASATLIGTEVDITSPHGDCLDLIVNGDPDCTITDPGDTDPEDAIAIDILDSSIRVDLLSKNAGASFIWDADDPPGSLDFTFDIVIDGLTWVDHPDAEIDFITISTNVLFGTGTGSLSASLTGPNQVTINFGDPFRSDCAGDADQGDLADNICGRLVVDITPLHPMPEPGTLVLLGLGLLGLGYSRKYGRA